MEFYRVAPDRESAAVTLREQASIGKIRLVRAAYKSHGSGHWFSCFSVSCRAILMIDASLPDRGSGILPMTAIQLAGDFHDGKTTSTF